ncbi:ABC transporter ATP-binding protein [Actinomadura sediminis]|uniref:ABC transporter ATP-binding protein n=1 Tax=Actinomadura sediminis TaxID=1038904 RepID=A0ABW3EZM0_9ACTN
MTVEFDGVGIRLGGAEIVRDVSFAVPRGRVAGLLGANGSGKSTLLRALYGAVRPHEGEVRIDGVPVPRLRPRERARKVAVVLQDTMIDADMTALEAVLLGRTPHGRGFGADRAADLRVAHGALDRVGAADVAGRPLSALSGGYRQRVSLARAIAQDGEVLVLDEPTNHLDIEHQLELMHLVADLGRTTIAVLHDLNLAAAHCDTVAVLHRGGLAAVGPPRDVLTPGLVREVFAVDAITLTRPDTTAPVLAFDRAVPRTEDVPASRTEPEPRDASSPAGPSSRPAAGPASPRPAAPPPRAH